MRKITANPKNETWIFGYGSLMWHPGFSFQDSHMATLQGYHRDMCILSYVFRGTKEIPGLVMGLEPGGTCLGRAFRIRSEDQNDIFAYLHEREMINQVYQPSWVDITLDDGRKVTAYTFLAIEGHSQHVGHLGQADRIKLILQGHGKGGSCLQYLENCCAHLRDLGIEDPTLETLLAESLKKQP